MIDEAPLLEQAAVQRVLTAALRTGGDFAEVFAEDRRSSTARLDDGKIEELTSGRDRGAGIRVVRGETTGFAHTSDLTEEGLRAAAEAAGAAADAEALERSLFDDRFLLDRPILRALRTSPSVLLVDEIDRADDEFEAFLLEVLSTYQVSIPEYGVVRASTPPLVVLTSNRTRELHDALKRRCLYHWLEHPDPTREVQIVRSRLPEVSLALAEQVSRAVRRIRDADDLLKPPGVAETLDWARALQALG
ncbi:MAG: hypothetical protein M3163_06015, partial [Actinomycetota bacterium]|nr:hypothetical protein [Actinomycetota bacterium]